jgi:hypothetical protein
VTARNPIAGTLLLTLGLLTFGVGIYFVGIRPPLLSEDIVFTGVAPDVLPQKFHDWLGIVFATWGGFTIGFALVLSGMGASLVTGRWAWIRWTTALALVVAFGRFLASNVILASDFLWFIAILFLLSLAATGSLAWGNIKKRSDHTQPIGD